MSSRTLPTRKLKKKAESQARKLHQSLDSKHQKLVVLCKKCDASKRVPELARWLQEKLPQEGVDAVVCEGSCLGPCPSKKLAVAAGGSQGGDWKNCWVLDPRKDRRSLLRVLREHLGED